MTIKRPLDGMLVLDLGQIYNGPYCGLQLGFMGARVLKIEPPEGDVVRRRKREVEPYPLVMLNSNKESVVLDLKQPRGKEIFLELVAQADVLIENFAAGVMDRLGIGWDVLSKLNPRLVYGGSSGFGLDGPYRDLPAMDVTVQAMSGITNATGDADGPPTKAGAAVCDFLAGIHLCAGILGALVQRERTGKGQRVEVAMHEAAVTSLASAMGAVMDGDTNVPDRTGNRHPALAQSGALALHQGAQYAGTEMDAGQEIAHRGARLGRRSVGLAGRVHDAAHRLDGDVHGREIAIGAVEAVARAAAIDQARVERAQHVPADAEAIHDAGGEILDQHIGLGDEFEEDRLAARLL